MNETFFANTKNLMSIKYKSTRGQQSNLSFEQVVLGGLANDKGLYVPESIPYFSEEEIDLEDNEKNPNYIKNHRNFLQTKKKIEDFKIFENSTFKVVP